MNINNLVIKISIEGTQAVFKGKMDRAGRLYQQAREAAQDDFEACIAAHYVARHQDDPEKKLYWHQVALERADAVLDGRVQEFYPSLYMNMGQSYELLGDQD